MSDDASTSPEPPLPAGAPPVTLQPLADVIAALRDPEGGCPWDLKQTHRTLREHILEEAYEAVDAIDADDPAALREELGDVLFHVAIHAQIAREAGRFTLQDVVDGITDKMIRRHPHVFGDVELDDLDEIRDRWHQLKRAEGRRRLEGVPRSMPPLTRSLKVSARAARVGFDWSEPLEVLDKVEEELGELREALIESNGESTDAVEEELGDLLFALSNVARKLSVDPAAALHRTTDKFIRRFAFIEDRLAEQGLVPEGVDLDALEALWLAAKREETRGGG